MPLEVIPAFAVTTILLLMLFVRPEGIFATMQKKKV